MSPFANGASNGFAGGFSNGFADGAPNGFAGGQVNGFSSSAANGLASGQSNGFAHSVSDGFSAGFSSGFAESAPNGFMGGQVNGFANSAANGFASEQSTGFTYSDADGFSAGFSNAFATGFGSFPGEQGAFDQSFTNGFDQFSLQMSSSQFGAGYTSNGFEDSFLMPPAPPQSSYVEVRFEEHDRPMGLVLTWDYEYPMVDEIVPGYPAQMWPQLVPGLMLTSINGYRVPPGAGQWEIEQQLQHRPLVLGFEAMQQTNQPQYGGPMHSWQLGECYRCLQPLVIRASEDLQSEVVAHAAAGAIVYVTDYGVGESGRRLRIYSGGQVGWISCVTQTGVLLLGTSPAAESEATDLPLALQESFDNEESEQAIADRREARLNRMALAIRDREGGGDDDDSEDGQQKLKKKPTMLKRMTTKLGLDEEDDEEHPLTRSETLMKIIGFKSPKVEEEPESSDEEEEDDGASRVAFRRHQSGIPETAWGKAWAKLDVDEHPNEFHPESKWISFKRKTGILHLQVRIIAKTYSLESEGSYFPAAYNMASHIKFETGIAFLIFLNSICIAVETFYSADDRPPILDIAEHLFTAAFLCEWMLRVMAFSWVWFFNYQNLFDTFLVWVTGVFVMWILTPIGVDLVILRRFGALRILRMARLCKAIRIIPFFKELWMLVQGVMECTGLLFWTCLLGSLVHYTFAVAMIELVAKDPKFEDDSIVQEQFESVGKSMITLFQIMTFDSFAGIIRPIIKKDPKSAVIFGIFIGLAGIVLFNLMTAIVVRNAFDAAAADEEAVAKVKADNDLKIKAELLEMFEDLDEDSSGALSIEEFLECMDDINFVKRCKTLDIDLEDLPDIFEILDDGDGQVDQQEFILGMMRMQGVAPAAEVLKATCAMRAQNVHFDALEESFVQGSIGTFRGVEGNIEILQGALHDLIELSGQLFAKLDQEGIRKIHTGTMPKLPHLLDPELEEVEIHETDTQKKEEKALEKGVKTDRDRLLDSLKEAGADPQEAFVEKAIPASWILKTGRSPLQQNPGRLKLMRDTKLKERLLNLRPAAKAKPKAEEVSQVMRESLRSWRRLDIPMDNMGKLDKAQINHGDLPDRVPPSADFLPIGMIGASPPAKNKKVIDPLAALGLPVAKSAPAAKGQPGAPPAPAAKSQPPQARHPAAKGQPGAPPAPAAKGQARANHVQFAESQPKANGGMSLTPHSQAAAPPPQGGHPFAVP